MSAADPQEPKRDRWTLLDVLKWTTGRFEERGLATPRLDAEVIIAAALRLPRVQLYVQYDRPLTADELALIRAHVRRRQAGESVAYVVGHKEFFGLEFAVDRRVLVPRPDTETLVDEALSRWRERAAPHVGDTESHDEVGRGAAARAETEAETDAAADVEAEPPGSASAALQAAASSVQAAPPASSTQVASPALPAPPRIADVGTGSGAIIVTLARQLPTAVAFAVDKASDALEVARANAATHGVTVTWLDGDLTAPLEAHAPFDLIVANLPYVPSGELAGLAPEVRAEPVTALDGGADGLDLVRRLITAAPALLCAGGALVLEIGAGQAARTAALCEAAGLRDVRARRDLGHVDRVVSAVKP